jgi:phospholipid/cholesterol/gamma-HCH transport system substrate-binding protein
MGAVVLVVAAFLLVFAYSHADLKETKGNALVAQFSNVAGLDRGGDVRINGIKVGTISSMALDPQTFNSVVTMSIRPDIALPTDSEGAISSDGLLGAKYIRLDPGHAKTSIPPGGALAKTKDFKSIEEMVGNLIFLATSETPKSDSPKSDAPKSDDSSSSHGDK